MKKLLILISAFLVFSKAIAPGDKKNSERHRSPARRQGSLEHSDGRKSVTRTLNQSSGDSVSSHSATSPKSVTVEIHYTDNHVEIPHDELIYYLPGFLLSTKIRNVKNHIAEKIKKGVNQQLMVQDAGKRVLEDGKELRNYVKEGENRVIIDLLPKPKNDEFYIRIKDIIGMSRYVKVTPEDTIKDIRDKLGLKFFHMFLSLGENEYGEEMFINEEEEGEITIQSLNIQPWSVIKAYHSKIIPEKKKEYIPGTLEIG